MATSQTPISHLVAYACRLRASRDRPAHRVRTVEAFEFHVPRSTHGRVAIADVEPRPGGDQAEDHEHQGPDRLGGELAQVAVEQAANAVYREPRAGNAVETGAILAIGEDSHRQQSPQAGDTVDGIAPTGSSMPRRSSNSTPPTTRHPATAPTTTAAQESTNGQGPLMATSRQSCHCKSTSGRVHLFGPEREHRGKRARKGRQGRVDDDAAEGKIGPGERASGVQGEPAEATIRLPKTSMGTWWPAAVAAGRYDISHRGPSSQAPTSPITPPRAWITPAPRNRPLRGPAAIEPDVGQPSASQTQFA